MKASRASPGTSEHSTSPAQQYALPAAKIDTPEVYSPFSTNAKMKGWETSSSTGSSEVTAIHADEPSEV